MSTQRLHAVQSSHIPTPSIQPLFLQVTETGTERWRGSPRPLRSGRRGLSSILQWMASFDAFGFPLCQAWDALQIRAMQIFVPCVDRRMVFLLWLPFSGEVAEPWGVRECSRSDTAQL